MLLQNHFLLSVPQVKNDYFSSSLILVCEHSEEGSVGFVINKPSNILLNELLTQANLPINRNLLEKRILSGGPVATNQCFIIHSDDFLCKSSKKITGSIYLTNGWEALEAISSGKGPKKFEITLGYAGWGSRQIEDEITRNVWLTVQAKSDIIFGADYSQRLKMAAQELGINLDLLSPVAGHG
tara:strand:- start:276 stop:824 length:549 start_codon:yes stop_codon:yes gene_type:complete